jgi:hypothetical protein
MIAASNDTRARLNIAARALLDEAGVLQGPAWTTPEGREFSRRLRAVTDGRFWVRNGACGEVVAVDDNQGEVVVDFAGQGGVRHRVHLPATYVDAHVEHGYALTDYGVQGRTLSRALAVLEEASTTAGTYMATTRGRHENRLYVATGDVIDQDNLDTSHGNPRIATPPLQELTARVATRRPDDMLHDRDPNVRAAARLVKRYAVPELESELRELDRVLDFIPNDQMAALHSALKARSQLIEHAEANPPPHAFAEELARRIARLDASIERISLHQRQRDEALGGQEARLARRAVVADAIAMRTLHRPIGDFGSRTECEPLTRITVMNPVSR